MMIKMMIINNYIYKEIRRQENPRPQSRTGGLSARKNARKRRPS